MPICRECRMTTSHKLGCSRRRQSGSTVTEVDTVTYAVPGSDYTPYDSGYSSSCDSSSSSDSGSSSSSCE